jgi:carboxylesterase type B
MGSTMAAYWTNFAKTGDPNGPGLPHWARYELASDSLLELGHTTAMRPVSKAERYRFFERLLGARLAVLQKRAR